MKASLRLALFIIGIIVLVSMAAQAQRTSFHNRPGNCSINYEFACNSYHL